MPGVGNDIVDLKSVETVGKARDRRFLEKVLTASEQHVMAAARTGPDRLLWAFWAAKETAYKAMSQLHGAVSAAPRRYTFRIETDPESFQAGAEAKGHVQTPAGRVWIRLFHHADYLHCIGTTDPAPCLEGLTYDLAPVSRMNRQDVSPPADPSMFVRRMAIEKIASLLGLPPDTLRIPRCKNARGPNPPTVHINDQPAPLPLSLSHHGRLAGYAVSMAAAAAGWTAPSADEAFFSSIDHLRKNKL